MNANPEQFLSAYFRAYQKLAFSGHASRQVVEFAELATATRARKGKLIFAGNGASAAIASHAALDFTKQARVRATTFHDAALMTAFANDYGYEHWMAEAIEHYSDPEDVIVLISVSGTSPCIVAAAQRANRLDRALVGFSGRHADNDLAQMANLSFHVPSHAYNIVENIHGIWISAAIDLIIGNAEYEVKDSPTSQKRAVSW